MSLSPVFRFVLFLIIALFLLPVSIVFADTPAKPTTSFKLSLTLGNRECNLEALNFPRVLNRVSSAKDYSSTVFRVPSTCVAIHSRLRASLDQAIWLGLSIDNRSDWLKLYTIETDENPPQLDKRGRYFGCAMPDNGFHTCHVGFEVNGQRYHVLVPIRVGVLSEHQSETISTTKTDVTQTISTASEKSTTENIAYTTPQIGRGVSIPDIGFYSSITTFPLTNGTWDIMVEEPLVGHLQGTAWIEDNSNIVLAGHSQYSNGANGIFAGLYNVNIGQEVVLNENDVERRYIVTDIRIVNYKDVSIVFPNQGDQLTLLTCHIPSYNQTTNNYDQRLVVIAKPI